MKSEEGQPGGQCPSTGCDVAATRNGKSCQRVALTTGRKAPPKLFAYAWPYWGNRWQQRKSRPKAASA